MIRLALGLLVGLAWYGEAYAQTAAACAGDCDGSGTVTITDLLVMVTVAEDDAPVGACGAGDVDGNGSITVDEIIQATNSALTGCTAAVPTPAPVAFTARVLANAADRPTAVAVADVNRDGFPDIVTTNGDSNSISVLLGQSDHHFAPAVGSPFSAGGSDPLSIAVADINGDGRLDLVTANFDSNTVSILLGQPDERFAPAPGSPFTVDDEPQSVVVADLDGDGRLDIVTGNVSVLMQQVDHSFAPAPGSPFDVGAGCVASIAVRDIDGDGRPDLVTANACNDTVSVALQQADHSFTLAAGAPFNIGFGLGPRSVAVADVNGDGRLDLVTANAGNNDRSCDCVSVLLQQSDHTFVPAPSSPFSVRGGSPTSLALTDVNGDGLPDIVTTNVSSNTVGVLLDQENATYVSAPGSPYSVANGAFSLYSRPIDVAVADVNGDGIPDIVTANSNGASASVLLGQPDHSFASAPGSPFSVGPSRPMSLTIADMNGDYRPDLVTANAGSGNLSVLLTQRDYSFIPAVGSPFDVNATAPTAVAVGDFDANGLPDLATANGDNSVSVLLQQAHGQFVAARNSPFSTGPVPQYIPSQSVAIAAGDFNFDGLTDLVTTYIDYSTGPLLATWLAQPDRSFGLAPGSPFTVDDFADYIAVTDLNHDGLPDLVSGNTRANRASLLLEQPDRTFAPAGNSPIMFGDRSRILAVADIDGDGRLDLITGSTSYGNVQFLLAQPDHSFVPVSGPTFNFDWELGALTVADLNYDKLPDLIAASQAGEVAVALQQSDHSFVITPWSPLKIDSSGNYFSIAVDDLNGDGLPDIATAGSSGIVVLYQTTADALGR